MMCLAIGFGILGALAFAKARRLRRAYFGHGGGCHGHHFDHHHGYEGHEHPRRHWGRRRRFMMRAALGRIDATPAQERAIVAEIDQLEARLKAARGGLGALRGELAEVMRGPSTDDAAIAGLVSRIDAATAEARGALLDALRNLHGLLDAQQRHQVAELLGKRGWRGGGGPYRM